MSERQCCPDCLSHITDDGECDCEGEQPMYVRLSRVAEFFDAEFRNALRINPNSTVAEDIQRMIDELKGRNEG